MMEKAWKRLVISSKVPVPFGYRQGKRCLCVCAKCAYSHIPAHVQIRAPKLYNFFHANKSQITNSCKFFLAKHSWAWKFAGTTVGIFIFISRENFMLRWIEHEKSFKLQGRAFALHSYILLVDNEGPDQPAQMWRLIFGFAVFIFPQTCFHMACPLDRCTFRMKQNQTSRTVQLLLGSLKLHAYQSYIRLQFEQSNISVIQLNYNSDWFHTSLHTAWQKHAYSNI